MKEYPQIFYPGAKTVNRDLVDYKNSIKGFTENMFEHKLEKYFKGHILKDAVLNDKIKYPYQPDYIFQYEDYDLFIDIEIDEPYAYKTKQPIHLNDENRNNYFLENGWGIIRFAEIQVTKYPELCCKVIAEYIKDLTNENIWIEGFHELKNLEFIEAWSFDKAKDMAAVSHREIYLKLLKRINEKKASINAIADGIFLNQQVSQAKSILASVHEIQSFNEAANISEFLRLLLRYAGHFRIDNKINGKIYIEFTIYISKHHSFYNFSFDTDFIEIGEYVVNVYYIRTGGIICFEIFDKIDSENLEKIILIADDPAYPSFLKSFDENRIILARNYHNTFMPYHFRYLNIDEPIENSLEIIYKESDS